MEKQFFSLLSKAINKYISLDPESAQRIHSLEGKIVTIELNGINIIFQLHFHQGQIILQPSETAVADTHIKGTPLSLFRLALLTEKKHRHTFFAEDVALTGDAILAEKVIEIFDHLEIDWEEYTSHWIGDVAAHQLGRFVRNLKSFNQRSRHTVYQNINEYVHEEAQIFPGQEELEDFFGEVDNIRMDVDRLAKKIEEIRRRV